MLYIDKFEYNNNDNHNEFMMACKVFMNKESYKVSEKKTIKKGKTIQIEVTSVFDKPMNIKRYGNIKKI